MKIPFLLKTNIKYKLNIFSLLTVLLFSSCYREEVIDTDVIDDIKVLNFTMLDRQYSELRSSRDNEFNFLPNPTLLINDKFFYLDNFSIRGLSSSKFERKSLSVNLDKKFFYNNGTEEYYRIESFKLISMVFDFTYIENSIGTKLMEQVGIWPLTTFYTEVNINNNSQGLYFFIEDPKEFILEKSNYDCIIRRGYYNMVLSNNCSSSSFEKMFYDRFKYIYTIITENKGEDLFNELNKYLDLEEYFRFLIVNYLLKNGDFTDELFFYTKIENDSIQPFKIIPWDLDDLFTSEPHEVGRNWSVGKKFGKRYYPDMASIYEDVGEKLIFSIEDDLDYAIAKDPYLYYRYLLVFKEVLLDLSANKLNSIFDDTYNEVHQFYQNDTLIAQSRFDANATNEDLLHVNISNHEIDIIDRYYDAKNQIDQCISESLNFIK